MAKIKDGTATVEKVTPKTGGGQGKPSPPLEKVALSESLKPQRSESSEIIPEGLPTDDGASSLSMEEVLSSLESMLDGEALDEEEPSDSLSDDLQPKTIKIDKALQDSRESAIAPSMDEDEVLDLTGMEIDFPTPVDVVRVTEAVGDEADRASLGDGLDDEAALSHQEDLEDLPLLESSEEEEERAIEGEGELSLDALATEDEEIEDLEALMGDPEEEPSLVADGALAEPDEGEEEASLVAGESSDEAGAAEPSEEEDVE
ncbi:MAG: hypothetical protein HQL75_17465, partial [Magnetococcales bacterium]|nr:hypothetical protein [Magnetococcales bacterium]